MAESPPGFQRVKVIALSVPDSGRAKRSHGETPGPAPAFEGKEPSFGSPV